MQRIQVVVASFSPQSGLIKLVETAAKQGKCKVDIKWVQQPEGVTSVVGIYAEKTRQRTRLQEMLFNALNRLSKDDVYVAVQPKESSPTVLRQMERQPKFVIQIGDSVPKHFHYDSNAYHEAFAAPPATAEAAVDFIEGINSTPPSIRWALAAGIIGVVYVGIILVSKLF